MNLKTLENKINIIKNKFNVGKFDEVIRDTKILLKKYSDQQILYNILTLCYHRKGENDKAIELLLGAIKKNPKNIFFLNNLGISYYNKKDLVEAEYYFKRALEINPKHVNALNNLANLKNDLNHIEEAKEIYIKVLKINDNLLVPQNNLAALYQSTGDFKKSIFHYRRSLEINPKFTKADRNISMMTKYAAKNQHFLEMQKKVESEDLNKNEKIELHFALGKAYDDLKDYKNSFLNINLANSLKKEMTKYNIESDVRLFKNIKNFFSKKKLNQLNANNKKIIFILGMPRSGTSLAEQIISSHKNVYGGGEIHLLAKFFTEKLKKNSQEINFDNDLHNFQKEYLEIISAIDNSKKVFTDKAPLNFRWIGFIDILFPNSKIIHCKRKKIDNCWSIYKNNFDGNIDFSNNLEDLNLYYNVYEDLMKFWNEEFEDKIYNLNYEELIKDTENQIKLLIKFCDLDWDANCLKFYQNTKTIKTVSFAQARKPIYTSSINASDKYSAYLKNLKTSLKS